MLGFLDLSLMRAKGYYKIGIFTRILLSELNKSFVSRKYLLDLYAVLLREVE